LKFVFTGNKVKSKNSSLITLHSSLVFFSLLFISLIIASCSTSKRITTKESAYTTDYPMTDDIAYSLSSDLTVRIPQGWTSAEDNDCKCIDLWLIRNDFSAQLNFITYEVDDEIRKQTINGNLDTLIYFSKQLKKSKLKSNFQEVGNEEYFELNDKPFAAYEYMGDEGLPIRIVVFQYKGRIFELSAVTAQKIGKGKVGTKELFDTQQSVLASIK
jgi:hypothetical protein